MSASWCTIESDPGARIGPASSSHEYHPAAGVFTELIAAFGTKGVQVEELYSMDLQTLGRLRPIYGFVFLFRWRKSDYSGDSRPTLLPDEAPGVFFAKQVINNACATQAIVSVLMNATGLELGDTMENYRSVAAACDPHMRGEILGASEDIRQAHNSFARADPFVPEEKGEAGDDDDVYHFVSYVPVDGAVYELDGLRDGPILIGEIPDGKAWEEVALPAIEARTQQYQSSEIRFNLLAMCADCLETARRGVAECEARLRVLDAADSGSTPAAEDVAAASAGWSLPSSADARSAARAEAESALGLWREQVHDEKAKREERHNYLPFLFGVMKVLARRKRFVPMWESAQERARTKREENAAKRQRKEGAGQAAAAAGGAGEESEKGHASE